MAEIVETGASGAAPPAGGAPPSDPGIGIGSAPPEAAKHGLAGPLAEPSPPAAHPKEPIQPATQPKAGDAPPAKVAPKVPTVGDQPAPTGKEGEAPPAPATWPENWREQLAGDNKKALDRLARFKSPNDVLNSYLALEGKLASGEFAKKLPSHYTETELAEYRKANGIPDTPDGYDTNIGNGIVWGEADKPLLESWKTYAHENHLPPEMMKIGLAWFAREQESMVDRLVEGDMHNFQAGTAALQAKWGNEFKGNLNAAKNLFEGHPGVWDKIMGSRNADGVRGGDDPIILEAIVSIAKDINPYATMVPLENGKTPLQSIDERIEAFKPLMRDKFSEYYRGAKRDQLQAEYRTLIEEKQKIAARTTRAA